MDWGDSLPLDLELAMTEFSQANERLLQSILEPNRLTPIRRDSIFDVPIEEIFIGWGQNLDISTLLQTMWAGHTYVSTSTVYPLDGVRWTVGRNCRDHEDKVNWKKEGF